MESTAVLIEGSDWGSFNGVSVNEEADFMAKMFPNSSMSHHELELSSSLSLSSSVYSGYESKNDVIMDESGSFNSNDSNSNCFSLSQESGLSERSNGAGYQCNEIYFVMSDADQFLAVDGTALPVGFCLDSKGCIQEYPTERNHVLNVDMSCDNDNSDGCVTELIKPKSSDLNLKLDMADNEPAEDDDKSGDLSEHGKKRCRKSEVQKGKRNVRSKRSQSSSSCISREELSGETSNAKTRCPRGSAIDPQSLYARKRRERINERLKILQNLIPNGTKVDISTMLEEAVQYVKFLELQIKLLSSDELWMFAPLAYNGLDIGLDSKLNSLLHSQT